MVVYFPIEHGFGMISDGSMPCFDDINLTRNSARNGMKNRGCILPVFFFGGTLNSHLVGGLVAIFYFPIYKGNLIIPTDELIFFKGVAQPPTSHVKTEKDREKNARHTGDMDTRIHSIPWRRGHPQGQRRHQPGTVATQRRWYHDFQPVEVEKSQLDFSGIAA